VACAAGLEGGVCPRTGGVGGRIACLGAALAVSMTLTGGVAERITGGVADRTTDLLTTFRTVQSQLRISDSLQTDQQRCLNGLT
jgi:hypothetical protein